MPDVTYSISGGPEVEAALLELAELYGPRNGLALLRAPVRNALREVLRTIKSNTPVDTGALLASARVTISVPTRSSIARREYQTRDDIIDGGVGWYWSRPSLWNRALAVEYGNTRVAADPVLVPAFESHLNNITSDLTTSIRDNIEITRKRLNAKVNKPGARRR